MDVSVRTYLSSSSDHKIARVTQSTTISYYSVRRHKDLKGRELGGENRGVENVREKMRDEKMRGEERRGNEIRGRNRVVRK